MRVFENRLVMFNKLGKSDMTLKELNGNVYKVPFRSIRSYLKNRKLEHKLEYVVYKCTKDISGIEKIYDSGKYYINDNSEKREVSKEVYNSVKIKDVVYYYMLERVDISNNEEDGYLEIKSLINEKWESFYHVGKNGVFKDFAYMIEKVLKKENKKVNTVKEKKKVKKTSTVELDESLSDLLNKNKGKVNTKKVEYKKPANVDIMDEFGQLDL